MNNTCPITVWPRLHKPGQTNRGTLLTRERRCEQPLAPGSRLCAKHEADRIRLGGDAA